MSQNPVSPFTTFRSRRFHNQTCRLLLVTAPGFALAILLSSWMRHQLPQEITTASSWLDWLSTLTVVDGVSAVLGALVTLALWYVAIISLLCLVALWWPRKIYEYHRSTRSMNLCRNFEGTSNTSVWRHHPIDAPLVPSVPRWFRLVAPTWLIVALFSFTPNVGAATLQAGSTTPTMTVLNDAPIMVVVDDEVAPDTTTELSTPEHAVPPTLVPTQQRGAEPTTYLPRSHSVGVSDTDQPHPTERDSYGLDNFEVTTQVAPTSPQDSSTYVVESGDHLWSIAESVMSNHVGRLATAAEVHSYWCDLIEVNRTNLVDPSNADLIFPGQQLTIPIPQQ